ncbi:hypothetical protein [Lacticaseibacillus parakribbianus]|uniref:hypothetical protein n=1 Tax=Lacticaseibacillus parakribbianus TaxID=2970927 RepID=UPI0021CB5D0B|nr:hypothetical protein [Lacticaseibacillus parakribbianus]
MLNHLIMFAPDAGAGEGGTPAGAAAGADPAANAAPATPAEPATPTGPSADEVQAGLLKDLGVGSLDDLKAIIEAKNQADAASRSDLENAQANLTKSEKATAAATARADAAEAKLAAVTQGVSADHIDDALALAHADLANKVGGAKTIDDALKGVLDRNPAFKSEAAPAANPDGSAIVGNEPTGNATGTTLSDFVKMKTAEQLEFKRTHPAEYAGLFK